MMVQSTLTPEEKRALATATLTAMVTAAGSALVTWFFAEAQRRLEDKRKKADQ